MSSSLRLLIRLSLPLLIVLAMLAGSKSQAQQGQDTFYNNMGYSSVQNLPYTNIINDYGGQFDVNPGIGTGWLGDLFAAFKYTRNYTNNGEMSSDTGFRFDRLLSPGPGHVESDNFYNAGNINCGTGTNAIFILEGTTLTIGGFGGVQIWATNVINSGTITIGQGGLGRIYGHNLDFTRGTLSLQNGFLGLPAGLIDDFTVYATGQTGRNTNAWFPDEDLLPSEALSSPPVNLFLANSTPYFSVDGDGTGTNFIVRMVFLQNDNAAVTPNVYFGSGFGNGFTTIEWVGSYIDPSTGQTDSHYLYLTDDYVQGSSTNILSYPGTGVPSNYSFFEQTTPLSLGTPQTSNYPTLFPYPEGPFPNGGPFPAGIDVTTNIYSYVNAQFVGSDVSTNSLTNSLVAVGALTNLPGRFELVASNELNLSLSTMSGMNYLRLQSTNNFDDDGQSSISAPFSDVYLGRTNNNMVISNLLIAAVPIFNGPVQAWTTRWFYTDTNAGVNYDFRVEMVESGLLPTSGSAQQDFVLYSSNNIVISDTLSIIRTFYANCTNLLLTTNALGNGAESFDGELNINTTNVSWATATPRLLYLTNNGAIRTLTLANYGNTNTPYFDFVNTGTVSNGSGVNIYAVDFENSGVFSSGSGSFLNHSTYCTMTNGSVIAGGIFSNVCSSFVVSNTTMLIGKSMAITVSNLLTDGGTTNNFWSLGAGNGGFGVANGLLLPIKPVTANLLGTTITNPAVSGTLVNELWSGKDYGAVNAGFSNNAALGQLVLDAQGPSPHTAYYFTGITTNGTTNAIYVDCLQLHDYASYTNRVGTNLPSLTFNTNLVIYYAQALIDGGTSVAEKINHFNNDHLRWVPTYVGNFSSVTLIYPDGTTNTVNSALRFSPDIDSDGDGTPNGSDLSPIFTSAEINFAITLTNLPPKSVKLTWTTPANSTNYINYKTNLLQPNWMPFTNFQKYFYDPGLSGTKTTNNGFTSPVIYGHQPTNVWIFDTVTNMPHYYQVVVQPWLTFPN